MRTRIGLVMALLLLSVSCLPAVSSDDDQAAVNEMAAQWGPAVDAGNGDFFLDHSTEDMILVDTVRAFVGKPDVKVYLDDMFSRHQAQDSKLVVDEFSMDGDWGYFRGVFTASWTPRDGSAPMQENSRYFCILKRQSDGRVKIARLVFYPI